MTSTLIIVIILLSAVLAFALYTLKQRNRAVPQRAPITTHNPRPLKASTFSGLPVELSSTLNDDLVLASLFQPPPIKSVEIGKQCGECARLYDERSEYCYFDGSVLSACLPFSATFWVCTTCGHEGKSACACEGGVFSVQSEVVESAPMIPSARCPACQDLGTLGSICEKDKIMRTPVFEMNFRTFPPKGFGPRRTVCLHCGSQYSSTAKYCSSDGQKLNLLN